MVAAASLRLRNAVLLGDDPCLTTFFPFRFGNRQSRLHSESGRIDRTDTVGRRLQTSVRSRNGVNPVAGMVLDNSVVVSIMKAMVTFVACYKEVKGERNWDIGYEPSALAEPSSK